MPPGWILLAAVIWATLCYAERSSTLAMILFRLPSTALHECLGHWLVAVLFGASPSIIPHRNGDGGWRLGSVTADVTWLSAVPIGLGPLLMLPGFWLLHRYTHISPLAQALMLPFVVQGATPSRQDLKVACSSLRGVMFWCIASGVATSWLSHHNGLMSLIP